MRWIGRIVAGVMFLGLLLAPGGARAATPAGGTLAADGTPTTWSGSFLVPDPAAPSQCPTGAEPFCDAFDLNVPALAAERPDVRIEVAGRNNADVLQLYVYGPDGTIVAEETSVSSRLAVTLASPAAGAYSVRVEGALFVPPGDGAYDGAAVAIPHADTELDQETPCGSLEGTFITPPEVLQAALTDDGRRIRLDILVLLDGITEEFARSFFVNVARPYAALGIDVAATYQDVTADYVGASTVTTDLIEMTRNRFERGEVPAAYDVVELLTAKDVQVLGQTAVAGQADCIGGIAYDTRSYNVSEAIVAGFDEGGTPVGPFNFAANVAAKITAHEIGHLLGGQHHFATCAEGSDPDEELAGDTSPCTLMFNSADLVSLQYSAVNRQIVRGYALLHAGQNDSVTPPPVVPESPFGVAPLPVAALALFGGAYFVLRRRPTA